MTAVVEADGGLFVADAPKGGLDGSDCDKPVSSGSIVAAVRVKSFGSFKFSLSFGVSFFSLCGPFVRRLSRPSQRSCHALVRLISSGLGKGAWAS